MMRLAMSLSTEKSGSLFDFKVHPRGSKTDRRYCEFCR